MDISIVTRTIGKAAFWVRKNLPTIMMVTGVGSMGAGAVWACKSTTKLSPVLEETEKMIAVIEESSLAEPLKDKHIRKVKIHAAKKIGKLYAPPVILFLMGGGLALGSNGVNLRRNALVISAYEALEGAYDRLQDKINTEPLYKITDVTDAPEDERKGAVEVRDISDSGEKQLVKIEPIDPTEIVKPYDRLFGPLSTLWTDDPDYALNALRNAQCDLNRELKKNGHLFLNNVYRRLGYPEIPNGQLLGWIYDETDPEHHSNVIDLGIQEVLDDPNHPFRRHVMGYYELTLKIRPDGVIWNKI